MQTYKDIFFDLDHTLWDFESNSAATLQILYDKFKLSLLIASFEDFRSTYEMHNERMWERFRNGYIGRKELRWKRMWHTLLDFKIGDHKLATEMSSEYLALLPAQGKLIPHAKEVLAYFSSQNYNLHLITNGFETTQWQKMKTSGIHEYFTQVITSEKSNSMKPKPEIFAFALSASGATLKKSIMIGDALDADISGAKNFGMDQVYFNPYEKPHTESPTFEIKCLSQLLSLF